MKLEDLPFLLPEDLYSGSPEDMDKEDLGTLLNRLMMDKIPALVHINYVPTGEVVWRNSEWNALVPGQEDYSQEEFNAKIKERVHPDDFQLLAESTDYFNRRKASLFGGFIRVKLTHREGWSWLIGESKTIKWSPKGDPLYTLAIFMDFTEATQTNYQITEALREVLLRSNKEILDKLTRREKQVLQLVVSGYKNRQIAEELFISHHTVESHRKNLKLKLNVKNSSEMIALAKDLGFH